MIKEAEKISVAFMRSMLILLVKLIIQKTLKCIHLELLYHTFLSPKVGLELPRYFSIPYLLHIYTKHQFLEFA